MARNTARSVIDGITFSTPITATCTRGSDVVMRPLPSVVTRTTVRVAASATLAPVFPRSAWRNFSRNSSRAIFVRTSGSAARPGRCSSRENSSATCPFVLWMAGAMICEGRSWASWMMYSPRSVSTGVTPIASSASLRWISSVAIDLDFTAMRAPVRLAMSRMIRRASSAVVAKCTWPDPLDVGDERLEVRVQPLERRLLDGAGAVAQRLALGKVPEGLAAQRDELRRRDVERLVPEAVPQGVGGALAEGRGDDRLAHRSSWGAPIWPPRSFKRKGLRPPRTPPAIARTRPGAAVARLGLDTGCLIDAPPGGTREPRPGAARAAVNCGAGGHRGSA